MNIVYYTYINKLQHIYIKNMSTYEYVEGISKNYLKLYVDANNIMWIHDYYVDPFKGKLFVIMLKRACDQIIEKHNCTKHMQYVKTHDWSLLKSDAKWKLEYEDIDAQVNLISCDILNAPVCICDAFIGSHN